MSSCGIEGPADIKTRFNIQFISAKGVKWPKNYSELFEVFRKSFKIVVIVSKSDFFKLTNNIFITIYGVRDLFSLLRFYAKYFNTRFYWNVTRDNVTIH